MSRGKTITPKRARTKLAELRKWRKEALKRSLKLTRYQEDIRVLRKEGGTEREIRAWLEQEKKLKVHQTTVHRFLKRLVKKS